MVQNVFYSIVSFQLNESIVLVFPSFYRKLKFEACLSSTQLKFEAYHVLIFNCRCEAIKHQNEHVQQPYAAANTRKFNACAAANTRRFNASRCTSIGVVHAAYIHVN
jgi:hypothetical protein